MRSMHMNTGDRWFLSLLICSHLSMTITEILLPFCYLFDRQTGRWNITGADARCHQSNSPLPKSSSWKASVGSKWTTLTKRFQASLCASHKMEKEFWRHVPQGRTAASLMTGMGIPRLTVKKILNHAEREVTAVYDRHSYDDEKRQALEAWATRLMTVVSEKSATKSFRA